MPPESALSLEAALAAQNWTDLATRLTRYTHVRLRKTSWASAEEYAQQAITELLDPAYPSWDRERHPDVFDCLGHIVNGIVANHFRRVARRGKHVFLRDDERTHDDEHPELGEEERDGDGEQEQAPPPDAVHVADPRTAEDLLTFASRDAAREALAMTKLRARLEGDALCIALLDRMKVGASRAAADAEALGVPVADVYTAKRRLLHHTRAVSRDLAVGAD